MDTTRLGFYLVVTQLILLLVCLSGGPAEAARGGGARGGSRGGSYRSSSYRSSSYRSSSYRSSSYRSTSYSSYSTRSGSRLYSSYISTRQTVRYSRVYFGYTGYYAYYYNMYYGYAGSAVYLNRRRPSGDVDVCVNYEANDNGTAIGVFVCPLPFEPKDFTMCCGQQYAEYCCKPEKKTNVAGIVIGVLVGVIVLVIIGYIFYRACIRDGGFRSERTTTTTVTHTSTSGQPPTATYGQAGKYDNMQQPIPPYTPNTNGYQPSGGAGGVMYQPQAPGGGDITMPVAQPPPYAPATQYPPAPSESYLAPQYAPPSDTSYTTPKTEGAMPQPPADYTSLQPGSAPYGVSPPHPGAAPYPPQDPGTAPYPPQDPGSAPYPPQNPGSAPYGVTPPQPNAPPPAYNNPAYSSSVA